MKHLLSVLILFLSLFSPLYVHAQVQEASPSASPERVDSYNLFWPLSAGKTESDNLYSFKLFKETVGGWFTFGDTEKVDYAVLLGTKRMLEAEKLLSEGKNEMAINALVRADAQYRAAYNLAKSAHSKSKFSPEKVRRDRLINTRRLIDYLKTNSTREIVIGLEKVKDGINLLLSDFLAKGEDSKLNI
jgi:hypothetical protein